MSVVQRGRSIAVLGFLLAGGVGIISSTQTWLTVTRADPGEQILVAGADAVALLAPLSLAVLALGAALAIVGPVMRHVFAVFGIGVSVLLGWSTAQILIAPPLSAVASAVTDATGLAGDAAVAEVVGSLAASFWPVLALAGWLILLLAGVFTLVTARSWKAGGKRFRTDGDAAAHGEGPVDAIDSWDDLSRGTDPTR